MKDTKERLLTIATRLFAVCGYEGVSTRELARRAGVNLSAITYYFGSKRELYNAVIARAGEEIGKTFPSFGKLADAGALTPAEAGRELKALLGRLFIFLCESGLSDDMAGLVLRELMHPTEAYGRIYAGVFEPVHKKLCALAGKAADLPADSPETLILAHTLLGQVFIFRLHREILLRRLEIGGYDEKTRSEILKIVYRNCDAVLNAAKEARDA